MQFHVFIDGFGFVHQTAQIHQVLIQSQLQLLTMQSELWTKVVLLDRLRVDSCIVTVTTVTTIESAIYPLKLL